MIVEIGERVGIGDHCPVCLSTTINDMGHYWFCAHEDPHAGGVLIYPDGRVVRLDRFMKKERVLVSA